MQKIYFSSHCIVFSRIFLKINYVNYLQENHLGINNQRVLKI